MFNLQKLSQAQHLAQAYDRVLTIVVVAVFLTAIGYMLVALNDIFRNFYPAQRPEASVAQVSISAAHANPIDDRAEWYFPAQHANQAKDIEPQPASFGLGRRRARRGKSFSRQTNARRCGFSGRNPTGAGRMNERKTGLAVSGRQLIGNRGE